MNRKQVSALVAAATLALAANGAFAANASKIDQSQDDYYLTIKIKAELARQPPTADLPVHVSSSDGVVALSGPVGTINQMARAVENVCGVEGVVKVDNRLQMIL